jgi:hypothetical protein
MSAPAEPRRAAIVRLGVDELSRILQLPDGWHVTGVRDQWENDSVLIRVTGPDAPICAPGMEPYRLQTTFNYVDPPDGSPPFTVGRLEVVIDWSQVPS